MVTSARCAHQTANKFAGIVIFRRVSGLSTANSFFSGYQTLAYSRVNQDYTFRVPRGLCSKRSACASCRGLVDGTARLSSETIDHFQSNSAGTCRCNGDICPTGSSPQPQSQQCFEHSTFAMSDRFSFITDPLPGFTNSEAAGYAGKGCQKASVYVLAPTAQPT